MPTTRVTSNVIQDGTIRNEDISSQTIIDRAKLNFANPAGVKTVYLAPRTDGIVGTGTELDPYDVGGPTEQIAADKYDAVISDRTKCPERCTIKLLSGNYFTNGTQYYSQYSSQGPSRTYRVWYPANCSVIGSGLDCTSIKWINPFLVNQESKGAVIDIFGNPSFTDTLSVISDITIDCNWQNLKTTTNPALMPGYPNIGRIVAQLGARIQGSVDHGIVERVKLINIGGDWTNGWESFGLNSNAKKTAIVKNCIVKNMIEGWDNNQPYVSAIGAINELIQVPLLNPGLVGYTYVNSEGMSIIEGCIVLGGSPNFERTSYAFSPSRLVIGNYCDKVIYGIHVDTGVGWITSVVNNYFGDCLVAWSLNFIQNKWSTPPFPRGVSYCEYINFENNIVLVYPRPVFGYNRIFRISGNTNICKINNNYFLGKNTNIPIQSVTFANVGGTYKATITTSIPHYFVNNQGIILKGIKSNSVAEPNNKTFENIFNLNDGFSNFTVISPTQFSVNIDSYYATVKFPNSLTDQYTVDGNTFAISQFMNAEIIYCTMAEIKNNIVDLCIGGLIFDTINSLVSENNVRKSKWGELYEQCFDWGQRNFSKIINLNRQYLDSPIRFNFTCTSTAPYIVTATCVTSRNLDIWGWDNGLEVDITSSSVPAYNGTYTVKNLIVQNNTDPIPTFQFEVGSALANANDGYATIKIADLQRGRDFVLGWDTASVSNGTLLVPDGTFNVQTSRFGARGVFPYTYNSLSVIGIGDPKTTIILTDEQLVMNTSGANAKPFKISNLTLKNISPNQNILSANEKTEADNCIFGFVNGLTGIYKNCEFLENFPYTGGNRVDGNGWLCGIAENCKFKTIPTVFTRKNFATSPFPEIIMKNCTGNVNAILIYDDNNVRSRIENCFLTNTGSNNAIFIRSDFFAFNNYFQNHIIRIDQNVDDKIFNCIFDFTTPAGVTLISASPSGTARTISIGNSNTNAVTIKTADITITSYPNIQ